MLLTTRTRGFLHLFRFGSDVHGVQPPKTTPQPVSPPDLKLRQPALKPPVPLSGLDLSDRAASGYSEPQELITRLRCEAGAYRCERERERVSFQFM